MFKQSGSRFLIEFWKRGSANKIWKLIGIENFWKNPSSCDPLMHSVFDQKWLAFSRRWHFHSYKGSPSRPTAGVSILKPLKFSPSAAGDLRPLKENLESFFQIDYPKFEILFCVRDYDDASIKIIENLMSEYPKVNAHLLKGLLGLFVFSTDRTV